MTRHDAEHFSQFPAALLLVSPVPIDDVEANAADGLGQLTLES
jgi:hypothetical protein